MTTATTIDERISRIWEALAEAIDPELGVPITDLGLVYRVEVIDDVAHIDITTTTPICPLGSYLQGMIASGVNKIEGIDHAEVTIVQDPPWCPDLMNDAARRALGWSC